MPKLEEATINIYEYPYPLTSEVHIPEGMFQNCKSLKKFTSNGTSKVYQYAFMACTALETLSTPDIDEIEQYAFAYCTNLKFTIYGTLLKVGDYAFAYCQNIKINTYNFTDAGKYIFIGSQAISTLDINRSLGEYEFYSCQQLTSIKLHENINTIPRYCFANCTKLTSVQFPKVSRLQIGLSCFESCTSLSSIGFDNIMMVQLGGYCFADTKIESLKLINTSTDIKDFYRCPIKSLTIGGATTAIADGSFEECTKLEKVVIQKDAFGFNALAFMNCDKVKFEFESGNEIINESNGIVTCHVEGVSKNMTILVVVLPSYNEKTFSLSDSYDSILPGAFYFAEKVEKIEITKPILGNLQNSRYLKELTISISNYSDPFIIDQNFCDSNAKLKKLTIEKAVPFIDDQAFNNCTKLKEVTLPESISFGQNVFALCTDLEEIKIPLFTDKLITVYTPTVDIQKRPSGE